MTFRYLYIIIILFLTISCRENKNKSDFVVLKLQTEWNWIYQNADPTKLTDLELSNVEKLLQNAVTEYNLGQAENIKERKEWFEKTYPNEDFSKSKPKLEIYLPNYKRQYIPVINDNGEKEVWVNLFCTTENTNWRNEIVKVYDGGNCYFNLKINLTKNNYFDFFVNGEI
ncbi:hypothetical protein [Thalassobellus citreus]|uniref:hypothetical protein n=1 Tax=Thalassobellus citreus TaxID=3367752 RepID=UPI0037A58C60